ncbi:LuxR C-terminal-related transcriptional regulator [uncultured Draconibacterium sp.]|uniref:LuxR C-terminal-related transcriptional regulator n=1 Tax=uncultured Draconibacterium sp. TaxID=1573823 RepID=UPI002AA9258B|nr:LuxR C-terminal-related transcriptional regulator [uncultured Draconibacterium sp.]
MLLTKLFIPKPSEDTIHRQELINLLNNVENKKLVLVSAPAGYGKTTLISDWIQQKNIAAIWCSIDKRDNDLYEFLKILVTAINKKFSTIGQSALELLQAPGTAKTEYIIELFLNDLLQLEKETVLVLDDLHLIENKGIFEILSTILEYKPPKLILIISTRSDPPLPLARLRSRNEILELRSDNLSFSKADIENLFNKKLRLNLSKNSIDILKQKTEGWIAGLQLSALTFKGQENLSAYIDKMAGDNRYIMDYLMEEVLSKQSEELKTFLLKTSILDQFSGSLCDTILSTNNSQQILESLEKENKFIIPLDHERKWFRYHHLFGDLLKQQLKVAAKSDLEILHNKASEWFENNQLPIYAIEHAIEAGNRKRALHISNKIANNLWETSQYSVIHKLGSHFTNEEMLSNFSFCIVYAWVLTVTGRVEEAETNLERLLKNPLEKKLLGRVYGTLNFIAVFKGDSEAAFRYSELATQNIEDDDILWGTWAYISYGEAHLLRFELDQSIEAFKKAKEKIEKYNKSYLNLIAESKSAYVLKLQGKFRESRAAFNVILENYSNSKIQRNNITSSIIYSMIGLMEVEQNNVEKGIELVLQGYELAENATSISFRGYSIILLAEAYSLAGNLDESINKIEELQELLLSKSAQWISVLAIVIKCKLFIWQGELEKAEKLLQQKHREDINYTFEKYFHTISKGRLLVAQGKNNESISLLEQFSNEVEADGAIELLIMADLLKAKAYFALNDKEKASASVISALRKTQDENYIRPFICEGEEIEALVKAIREKKKTRSSELLDSVSTEFLDKLIDTFEKEKQSSSRRKEELLTSRELETLQLLTKDLSNQEIADQLFISLNTVKTRLKNINLKLEVDNRRKAVIKGKELGLI